jgi:hypothetical protein
LRIARRRFPNYLADCFMDKAGHKIPLYLLDIGNVLPLNVNWVKYNRIGESVKKY